jgi:hypothetical protein
MARNLTTGLQRGLRRSIAGGLGANDLFSIAPLDLRFAQQKTLDPRVTFTRQSRATYVDSDGVIRTATTNLLLRSEEFDTTWVQPGIVSANTEIAPNGTLTADTITSGGTGLGAIYQNVSVLASTIYTASVYVKLGTMSSSNYKVAVYNNSASNFIAVDVTPSQTPNSSGWTRVTYTFTTPVGCTSVRWYPFRIESAIPLSTVYLWGSQLEQSTTVGEYIPTTSTINSAPRFDHDPTTGESLGLLVEENRTNSFEWSNSANNNETWNNVGTYLNLASGQSDPAGGTAGIRATDANSVSSGTHLQRTSLANLTASTTVTYSVWLKPIDCPNNAVILTVFANTTTDAINATFSVSGTAITAVSTSATGTGAASGASFEVFPNGWYLCRLTGVPSTVTMADVRARINLGSYQRAAGTARFDWYGAQLESGAFATSYIPTSGTAANRAADVASISGSNFSSWYRQDEGTVFAEATPIGDNGSNQFVYALAQGTGIAEEIFLLKTPGTNSITNTIRSSSSFEFSNSTDSLSPFGSNFKNAIGASSTSTNSAVNGVIQGLDTSVVMPTIDNLVLGRRANTTFLGNLLIRRLTYWPTRLPDDTLQTITV